MQLILLVLLPVEPWRVGSTSTSPSELLCARVRVQVDPMRCFAPAVAALPTICDSPEHTALEQQQPKKCGGGVSVQRSRSLPSLHGTHRLAAELAASSTTSSPSCSRTTSGKITTALLASTDRVALFGTRHTVPRCGGGTTRLLNPTEKQFVFGSRQVQR